MIIVIGMDNTGKTTLVKELSRELELPTIKSPGPIPANEQKEWVLKQLATAISEEKIHERFPVIEEVVYGTVLRGTSVFSYDDYYFKLLKAADPIIVYLRPSNENIFNFGDREQFPGIIEKKEKLLSAFDELAFRMISDGWKLLTYNYEYQKVEELARALKIYEMIRRSI